ncbi:protein-export chaperone SecB [Cupriavidus sp. D39]|uniref:protein-export chaperone SecB n=1 Tax=Cupriavidus sp. D39 TaxID=2997877 RepID=UPI00226DC990|nr:protein-export chaperone SecB [Cupriavidus sp. D39]MCY0852601.1 protein-export chaperone SecB [Cupriavidus sp. D39]
MKASPLTLNSIKFLHVGVFPRDEPEILTPVQRVGAIDTNGVNINCSLTHAVADHAEGQEARDYMVSLSIQVNDGPDKVIPYKIDVACVGYFSIPHGLPDPVLRADIAVVNGASLLYGAIREQVSNITSRCWYGELQLPSLNFRDEGPIAMAEAERQRAEAKKERLR